MPAKAGIQAFFWIPAGAGMTSGDDGHFILWRCTQLQYTLD